MGLSITNNVASLNAQNSLTQTSGMLSKTLERLSTGLKINRGGDGPAALVISEQQRAQIAGLQTAIDNTSKAVSMVQTTEGALNEINTLLVKIRSLALDSANSGVNDSSALAANQAEISTALDTINRIANNTQFGNKKVLDGSLGATVARADVANAKIESQVTTGLGNVSLADGNYKLKITTAFVPAVTGVAATSTSALTATSGGATFFNTAAAGGGTDVTAANVVNASYFTEAGNVTIGGKVYAYTANTQVSSLLATINADAGNRFQVTLNDSTHQFTVTAENTGTIDNGAQLFILGTAKSASLAATAGGVDAVTRVDAAGEITDNAGNSLASRILLTAKALSDGTVLENTALGIQFDVKNSDAQTVGDKGVVYSVTTTGGPAVFQIGANAGQTASLSVSNVNATQLGTGIGGNQFASLNAINVTTSSGAQDTLGVVDKAIGQITTLRANLGAFQQNTLESTANNLRTTLENTTAAESVIRDTDFAKETANMTKYQVLMQVGTSVLTNSNQVTQLVLGLFR